MISLKKFTVRHSGSYHKQPEPSCGGSTQQRYQIRRKARTFFFVLLDQRFATVRCMSSYQIEDWECHPTDQNQRHHLLLVFWYSTSISTRKNSIQQSFLFTLTSS